MIVCIFESGGIELPCSSLFGEAKSKLSQDELGSNLMKG